MNTFISVSKLAAGLIAIASGLYTLFSFSGDISPDLPGWVNTANILIFSALGLLLVLGSILDFITERRKNMRRHRFQYQSKRFFKFFSNWYGQPGLLSIICDDLDWIQSETNLDIYNKLLDKSDRGQLNLLLGRGIHSAIASELKSRGANVMPAPADIVSTYTFSCISVMDDAAGKIIVRNKRGNPQPNIGEVIFEEISNTYITALLNALMKR